jgi:1-pyrroline-5-carboxylate dehydrogenase
VFVHQSADKDAVVTALLRGAYEFSGQKCSAASRAYVPASMWKELKGKLVEGIKSFKVGNPEELDTMVGPVIHKASFERCKSFIQTAKSDSNTYTIHAGMPLPPPAKAVATQGDSLAHSCRVSCRVA